MIFDFFLFLSVWWLHKITFTVCKKRALKSQTLFRFPHTLSLSLSLYIYMNSYTRLLSVCASGARLSSSSSSLQVLISNLYFFKRTLLKKISFYSLFICYNWILATTTCTEISNTVSFSTHSRERRRRCTGFDLSVFLQTGFKY